MKLAIALIVFCLVPAAAAQQPFVPGSSSIEGIVVKQGTNEPLAGVELELSRAEEASAPELKYTRTGSDGKFLFKDLKEGKYRLAGALAGGAYYPAEFAQRHPRQRGLSFPLASGQEMKDVKLEMTPTGAISGRVVDENGQPLGHVVVLALTEQFRAGEQRSYIETAAITDEQGNYRLFWLAPGRYSVAAVYEDPQRRTLNVAVPAPGRMILRERATSAVVGRQTLPDGSVTEEAYGVVYYGGVLDPRKATTIEVRPGTTFAGADIPMGAGKKATHHIRGVVINGDTGQPAAGAQVLAIPRQWSPNALVLMGTSNDSGVFDLAGAFPEGYVVSASGSGAPLNIEGRTVAGPPLVGLVPIDMGASDAEVRIVLNGGITLRGLVVIEGRLPPNVDSDLSKMKIRLTRDPDLVVMPDPFMPQPAGSAPVRRPANGQVTGSGEFTLTLSPGDFRVDVEGIPETTYLKSVRMGGEDLLRSGLHLAKTPDSTVEIALGTDGGTISGSVVEGTRPFSNATIALVPEVRSRLELYRATATDSTGVFQLGALPPGNYKLFAWEWAPLNAWQNPEFMRAYESQGTSIQVAASGKAEPVQLTVILSLKEAR